jgi:hypothetical protein
MRFTHFEALAYQWMVKVSAIYLEKKLYIISAMMGKLSSFYLQFIIFTAMCGFVSR